MFNSTGNNFGAGTIQFKDYQADNYVVLNSKFSYRTDSAEYQAASQLEIYVPDLTIDRSAAVGVFMRFLDRRTSSGSTVIYDGGTVLKSWIKDKNTIAIEKLTNFDDKGEIIIYICTVYPTLNQGSNTVKGTKTNLSPTQPTKYLYWSNDTFFVAFEHWVFLTMHLSRGSDSYRDQPWECSLPGFPTDVTADIPFCGAPNQFNPTVDGMAEVHIESGVWTNQERSRSIFSSGYTPFIFAFLVRDGNNN